MVNTQLLDDVLERSEYDDDLGHYVCPVICGGCGLHYKESASRVFANLTLARLHLCIQCDREAERRVPAPLDLEERI